MTLLEPPHDAAQDQRVEGDRKVRTHFCVTQHFAETLCAHPGITQTRNGRVT